MGARKLQNYVNGKWIDPETKGYIDVENPSTGEIIAQSPLSTTQATNTAIEKAHAAFAKWSTTPVAKRCDFLFKLVGLIDKNADRMARLVTEEMGKSLTDARAEIKRVLENTEAACGMPILQQGDKLIGSSKGIDGEVILEPLGVFAMIAPFNFPTMVPFWFLPYALATGNTYVVKPSKQVPCSMALVAELIDAAGFPPGVFNTVNGDRDVAQALMEHPFVQGVSIVGSTPTCRVVAEECSKRNKRFQALGAAKNHLVVMPDAKIEHVIRNMTTSCYGCAGQRCMASSAIVCVGDKTYSEVCERFVEDSKNIIVGNPLNPKIAEEPMVMGPVISAKAKNFVLGMIKKGVEEGATLALDGSDLVVEGCEKGHFIGPTVFTDVKLGMEIQKTELFGPVVVIMKAGSFDEAIQIINSHQYGNGASIYTQNGHYAREFKLRVHCGMIGINIGIPAPVASLPFGGQKESFFGDTKGQGKSAIRFFTQEKIITERFWSEG